MMRKDPKQRPDAVSVYAHPVVARARAKMDSALEALRAQGDARPESLFKASPLAGVEASFLSEILNEDVESPGENVGAGAMSMAMDMSA